MTLASSKKCWHGAANRSHPPARRPIAALCGATDLVMIIIVIVKHSGLGHTRRQAEFNHAGACQAGTDVYLSAIYDNGDVGVDAWDLLLMADEGRWNSACASPFLVDAPYDPI
jgi:hypothetical protein